MSNVDCGGVALAGFLYQMLGVAALKAGGMRSCGRGIRGGNFREVSSRTRRAHRRRSAERWLLSK